MAKKPTKKKAAKKKGEAAKLGPSGLPQFLCTVPIEAMRIDQLIPLAGGDVQLSQVNKAGEVTHAITVTGAFIDEYHPQEGMVYLKPRRGKPSATTFPDFNANHSNLK